MTRLSLFKGLGLVLGCTALALTNNSICATDIRANGGTTSELAPTADPGVFTHTVDGVDNGLIVGVCANLDGTVHGFVRVP